MHGHSISRPASGDHHPRLIRRGNLHEEVANVLRDLIITRELTPGSRIPEAELCDQLGVSRTPMREAIRVLVAEGLATLLPRRGAVVATATADELRGLFLTVGGIESVCAPLACENLTSAEIGEIEQHHAKMLAHQAAGNRAEYFRANQAVHQAVVRASKNRFIVELHAGLSLRILRSRFFSDLPASAWARSTKEHKAMIRLIRKRDGAALGPLMLKHMIGSWSDVEAQLAVQG